MTMTGIFRIALLPGADEKKFVEHMVSNVFDALQLTRITRGFAHSLLKPKSEFRQYAWLVTVDLVADGNYDFNQNRERVEQGIAEFGLLIDIDVYVNLPTKTGEE
jgi:hypothetical protein